jgi:hypothetical protein
MEKLQEDNLDVLQNLEFTIIRVYRADPSLLDLDAGDAVDALVRHYHAEEERRTATSTRPGERAKRVFLSVQKVCEWRVGRSPAPGETEVTEPGMPLSLLVKCLREIQKSIRRWSKRGGRKEYLDLIGQFLP